MCFHTVYIYKLNLVTLSEVRMTSRLEIWRLMQNKLARIRKQSFNGKL